MTQCGVSQCGQYAMYHINSSETKKMAVFTGKYIGTLNLSMMTMIRSIYTTPSRSFFFPKVLEYHTALPEPIATGELYITRLPSF
mmetsp:Transcript_13492/g.18265  ORF Transcript_13492/g.18265 Transcript_13492/m.18265 type:complete len:85 (+) Transcript_13492:134-388(+)